MRLTTFAAGVLMACGAATLSGCATAPPPANAATVQAQRAWTAPATSSSSSATAWASTP